MSLQLYNRKRNFRRTPEPSGKRVPASRNRQLLFVIQKHGARNTQVQVFGSPPSTHVAERRPAAEPRRALRSQRSAQRPEAPKVLPAGTRSASLVRLPSGSPYAGRDSFVHNGVKYVRVR